METTIPGAPWTGLLAMTLFTTALGVFFGWVTLRGERVWPAVVAHAAVNAFAGIGLLFVTVPDGARLPVLLGPAPTGVIALVPWLVVAIFLLVRAGGRRRSPFATLADPLGDD